VSGGVIDAMHDEEHLCEQKPGGEGDYGRRKQRRGLCAEFAASFIIRRARG
jgi:hypothetical protein